MTDKLDEIEKTYTVYMDATDFLDEQGNRRGGNQIFATPEAVLKHRKCADDCGVIEVEVSFKGWAQKPNPNPKLYTPEEVRAKFEARKS